MITKPAYQEHSSLGNDITALHLAAEKGSLTACQFIINPLLYKGGKDRHGRTPIDTAAIHCKWDFYWKTQMSFQWIMSKYHFY